jgi:hypothetical protein
MGKLILTFFRILAVIAGNCLLVANRKTTPLGPDFIGYAHYRRSHWQHH